MNTAQIIAYTLLGIAGSVLGHGIWRADRIFHDAAAAYDALYDAWFHDSDRFRNESRPQDPVRTDPDHPYHRVTRRVRTSRITLFAVLAVCGILDVIKG